MFFAVALGMKMRGRKAAHWLQLPEAQKIPSFFFFCFFKSFAFASSAAVV